MKACLYPDCKRRVHCRGLCMRHYQCVKRMVNRGETDWGYLERNGRTVPAKKTFGRGARNEDLRRWVFGGGGVPPALTADDF